MQTNDARLSDARAPTAGSTNYVQNTTTQQAASNFNISGNGTAGGTLTGNVVNAATQFNLNGTRILSNPGSFNLFVGALAGRDNTASGNTFIGTSAGLQNTTGDLNAFFGANAGLINSSGRQNTFFGNQAGLFNRAGSENSFFGQNSGAASIGSSNSFFGANAGGFNTTGSFNIFIGRQAGLAARTGSGNVFIGNDTGFNNVTGSSNILLGSGANVGSDGLTFATAIGAGSVVASNNTIVLGRSNGADRVQLPGLGAAGSTQLCHNANNEISICSSSLRYKTDLAPYRHGLDFINRLQPISFTWKDGGMRDLGFGAEDVARVDPLLAVYNKEGQVEGVKYDRLSALLVNAVKEQQTHI